MLFNSVHLCETGFWKHGYSLLFTCAPVVFQKLWKAAIPEIEYLFADPAVIGQVLLHPKNSLKWAQCTFAGMDAIFKALEQLQEKPDVKICQQTSGFGQIMGEYVIGHIIAREKKFEVTKELQKLKCFD
ncbi:hypothetical protein Btru_008647 [Bulinus truncatus]|nr:hypothetical protein Btru_008647 [Bulinus truncatus]